MATSLQLRGILKSFRNKCITRQINLTNFSFAKLSKNGQVICDVEAVGKPEKHWVFEEKLAVIR